MAEIIAGRRRMARVPMPAYGCTFLIDYHKPRADEALQIKDLVIKIDSLEGEARQENKTLSTEASALLRDLAAQCAVHIDNVRAELDGEAVAVRWADHVQALWEELSEYERAEVALENAEVCIWPIVGELVSGAVPSTLGKSSAPQS